MIIERVLEDLLVVKQSHEEFLLKHGKEIREFVSKKDVAPEENLLIQVLLDIISKFTEIDHAIELLQKPIAREGILLRDAYGNICLDEVPLLLMQEVEVFVEMDKNDMNGWTRTFVGTGENGDFLVGLPRDLDIVGLRARIRE